MNIFLIILLAIVGIIVLFLVIALFTKKDYAVERSIEINRPVSTVFDYIKYLKNQNNYSKWGSLDPGMKVEFTGTDAAPGFVSAWEGNKKVGKGEQEIKSITEGQRIDTEIRFIKPFPAISQAYMTTEPVNNNGTLVKWGFASRMNYPMNIMLVFMNMDKMVGNDFATGLSNLKNLLEKQ